jgi:hypothetical protein
LGIQNGEEALESEFDGADLVTPVLRNSQRGGGDATLRSNENRTPRLNQRHVRVPLPKPLMLALLH